MSGVRRIFAMVAALSMGAACTEDQHHPTTSDDRHGTVVLFLTTPHSDDGAVLFEVIGPAIDSATAVSPSIRLFTRRVGGSLSGALVGEVASGAVVLLHLPDVESAGEYRASVREVADRQDSLRASLTGYLLRVSPAPPL
jgi:hypothetical protein